MPFHRFSRSHCRDLYIGHLNSRCSFSIIWSCDLKARISRLPEIWPVWFSIYSLLPWHSSLPAVNSDANLLSLQVPSLVPFVESCIKLFFAFVLTAMCMRNGYDHGNFRSVILYWDIRWTMWLWFFVGLYHRTFYWTGFFTVSMGCLTLVVLLMNFVVYWAFSSRLWITELRHTRACLDSLALKISS